MGQEPLPPPHTVADFSARAGRGTVERFYGGGEVVRLSLQRDDTLDVLHLEIVRLRVVCRSELLDDGSFGKGHIVLVGRYDFIGILLGGLLNHLEEGRFLLFSVYDECTAENLVTAVLRVNLGETEDLAVGQRTTQVFLHLLQVGNLLRTEGQTFLLIVRFQVFDMLDGFGFAMGREDLLVQALVHTLQHRVILGVLVLDREILLDTRDALETHVLGNLYGIGAPRSDHLPAWTYKISRQVVFSLGGSVPK